MEIHGKDVSIEDILGKEDLHDNLSKVRENQLLLSDYQVSILEKNQIPYHNCHNMMELSFQIEEVLNNSYEVDPELEEVSRQIDEYRYYHEIHH